MNCLIVYLVMFLTENHSQKASQNEQSLQLKFQLALKERDASLREKAEATDERDQLLVKLEQLRLERDRALESLNGQLAERSLDQ